MARTREAVGGVAGHRSRRAPVIDLQAAATAFGQFALECRDLPVTITRGVELVARMVNAPVAALIRVVDLDRADLVCARGSLGAALSDALAAEFRFPSGLLARTEGMAGPLVIHDSDAEPELPGLLPEWPVTVRSALLIGLRQLARPHLLLVADTRDRHLRDIEVDFSVAVAHLLAAAMERHRHEAAQAALAAFGRLALESRSIEAPLQRAVDLATELLDTSFGFLIRVAGTHRLQVVHGRGPLGEPFDGDLDVPGPLVSSLRSAEPVVIDPSPPWRWWISDARSAPATTCLTVGFRAAGEVYRLGVVGTDAGGFAETEIDTLQSIAHLLAVTLERDRAVSLLRETRNQLQQALLPAALPQVPGIQAVARYVPAGHDRVGGDWYDVLPLPHGGVGLVMGDVEGHDSGAAAVMGQVRNVLRAYVAEGHPPAEVLSRVNRFVTAHVELLVTCCYAELRPDDLTITCVSAGHPMPVIIEQDGAASSLPVRPGLLLGVDPEHDYQEHTSLLSPGCSVLLVTDGLVDDWAGAIHPGYGTFYTAAGSLAGAPLEQLADRLSALPPGMRAPRDDAALLAIRVSGPEPAGGESVERVFAPSPAATPAARRYVVDLLTRWDHPDLCDAAALAVSELVTNAVMHTTSSVRLVLRRRAKGVWIGVHDTNDRLPVRPRPAGTLAPGGRGLAIVEQIADRWGVAPTPESGGKTVWLEISAER